MFRCWSPARSLRGFSNRMNFLVNKKKLRITYNRVKDLTKRRLSLSKLPSEKVQFLVSDLFLVCLSLASDVFVMKFFVKFTLGMDMSWTLGS